MTQKPPFIEDKPMPPIALLLVSSLLTVLAVIGIVDAATCLIAALARGARRAFVTPTARRSVGSVTGLPA